MSRVALFLFLRPAKRCYEAANKRPYASFITSSGAAFNSITTTLCLNKGSAFTTDLIGAGDGDGDGERSQERSWTKGVKGLDTVGFGG